MTGQRMWAIVLGAIVCGAAAVGLVRSSDHLEDKAVWTVFGAVVGWSFIGTGLYVARRRPETRTAMLMVLFGFAWFVSVLAVADWRCCTPSGWWPGACGAGCSCTS